MSIDKNYMVPSLSPDVGLKVFSFDFVLKKL